MDSSIPGADGARLHVGFLTTCGREIQVGHLAIGGGRHPAQRVSLDIGALPGGGTGTWAGLTVAEARRLAAALLTQAAACAPGRHKPAGKTAGGGPVPGAYPPVAQLWLARGRRARPGTIPLRVLL